MHFALDILGREIIMITFRSSADEQLAELAALVESEDDEDGDEYVTTRLAAGEMDDVDLDETELADRGAPVFGFGK